LFPAESDDDYEDRESAELFLTKIRDKLRVKGGEEKEDKDRFSNSIYPLSCIPAELVGPIMKETIDMIQEGSYTPDVLEHLFEDYGLSDELGYFFNNEAVSMIRLKTLTPEEFVTIGTEYQRQALEIEEQERRERRRRHQVKEIEPLEIEK
jgi:hypothetical protein